jgi:hypothetical protein
MEENCFVLRQVCAYYEFGMSRLRAVQWHASRDPSHLVTRLQCATTNEVLSIISLHLKTEAKIQFDVLCRAHWSTLNDLLTLLELFVVVLAANLPKAWTCSHQRRLQTNDLAELLMVTPRKTTPISAMRSDNGVAT